MVRQTDLCIVLVVVRKWTSFIGPLICFWMFNGKSIILNDYKTADSLLNRRSAIYSSRPTFWMSGYLAKRENTVFIVKTSNPRFKIYRTLLHKTLNQRAIQSYRNLQMDECKNLLKGLLETPREFITHIRRHVFHRIHHVIHQTLTYCT
jgi:cytochrome P450